MHELIRDWKRFWFSARPPATLSYVRVAISCVAGAWFASFINSTSAWFTPDGLLTRELSEQLLQFDQASRWQNWSPLWLSENAMLINGWLIIGLVLSLVSAIGLGGRTLLVILLLWVIAWAHRITWLQGPVEPALVASLAYLIVEPGGRLWGGPTASSNSVSLPRILPPATWQAGLALRLLQTHWWLLVAAGLLSQLASLIWWRGEGVWWLASAGRSHLLSLEMLRGQPALTNALSHGVIVAQMLALWLLIVPSARSLGIALGVLVACIYGLVADQLLYGLLLASMLISFYNSSSCDQQSRNSQ